MKRIIFLFVTIVTILFSASSCYYDNEEVLYPNLSVCDTSNVTFSKNIMGMLSDNCLSCHSSIRAPANGNNVTLDSYATVAARAVTISGSINHSAGFSAMPKNGQKLNSCLIRQFDIWRQQGSPNN